jgi:hypothetical protein
MKKTIFTTKELSPSEKISADAVYIVDQNIPLATAANPLASLGYISSNYPSTVGQTVVFRPTK